MPAAAEGKGAAGARSGGDLEQDIGDLARRQHGVVTRAQLLALGLGPRAIEHRVVRGRLRRLHRGVYGVGPIMLPHTREMAAALACGGTALVADWDAAALWSLASNRTNPAAPVQVLTLARGVGSRPGIRVRHVRFFDPADRACLDGIPVTSPARTLVDLAVVASVDELEQAVARAERERLVSRAELTARLAQRGGGRGAVSLRTVLQRAGGPTLTRSEAEARFLQLVRQAQLPPPRANVRIAGREVDFLWRGHGIAVEVDGYRFHSTQQSFEADRLRIAALASQGIHVIPVTWRQIVEEGTATAVRIGQALLRAELRRRQ